MSKMENYKILTKKDLLYLRRIVKLDNRKSYKSFKKRKVKANCMTKKEEQKFFGHGFGPTKKSNFYIDKDGTTLLFDKLKRFCDILPKTEDNIKFLSKNRGVQYEMFIQYGNRKYKNK